MRVLQIVDNLGMGGAETWLMEVLRLWSRKHGSWRMDFLVTSGQRHVFDDEAEMLGATLHYVRYGRGNPLRFSKEFRRILQSRDYDAVHDHQDYSSGWHFLMGGSALPAVRVTHVHNPAYQIRHNYGVTPGRRAIARVGGALVARYATHITGTSRQVIAEYGFNSPRFERQPKAALHCGFDPRRFLGDPAEAKLSVIREFGWPDDSKVVLCVGRIDQSPDPAHPQTHKNSGLAVSIGIEGARRDPRVRMLLVGAASPAVPVLERQIAAAGLGLDVRFAGVRRDVERLMLGSDVLLFPSRGEGLGMVAVEAQAAGLPVLASDSVPRECVVVPALVHFRSLKTPAGDWAAAALALMERSRDVAGANCRVAGSAFAIAHSAEALARLYSQGRVA